MRRERGAALVEVAISLPMVVALFAGLVDFGLYFHQQTYLELGLRGAVRAYQQDRTTAGKPEVLAAAAKRFANLPGLAVSVRPEGEFIRIEIEAPIQPILPGMRLLGYPEKTVSRVFLKTF